MSEQTARVILEQLRQIPPEEWSRQMSLKYKNEARLIEEGKELILGIINGLDGNIDEMHKNFASALAHSPNDLEIILQYATSLYQCGLYSAAIQILLPVADDNPQAALLMARSCRAMGLDNKARSYYACANHNPEEELQFPLSLQENSAVSRVHKSFREDAEIWHSLSTR